MSLVSRIAGPLFGVALIAYSNAPTIARADPADRLQPVAEEISEEDDMIVIVEDEEESEEESSDESKN